MPKWIPLASRGVAATDVLNDDYISARHHLENRRHCPTDVLVIRRTHQDDGKFFAGGGFRAINVSEELDPVPRLHWDIVLNNYVGGPGFLLRAQLLRKGKLGDGQC